MNVVTQFEYCVCSRSVFWNKSDNAMLKWTKKLYHITPILFVRVIVIFNFYALSQWFINYFWQIIFSVCCGYCFGVQQTMVNYTNFFWQEYESVDGIDRSSLAFMAYVEIVMQNLCILLDMIIRRVQLEVNLDVTSVSLRTMRGTILQAFRPKSVCIWQVK